MKRTAVFYGVLAAVALGMGCGNGGSDSSGGGLTSGGVGGTFPTGGIGGTTGGAGGALAGTGGAGGTVAGTGGIGGAAGMMTGGMGGAAGMITAGTGGAGGMMAAGTGGAGGMMAAGAGGTGGMMGAGDCCPDGNCICHEDPPASPSSADGPYNVESYTLSTGTVYYPTDAEPPLSAIAICPGFLNSGPEMAAWGPFYASHGFVLIAANTLPSDFPDIRATLLLGAIDELKAENDSSSSPLSGKLSGRFGTSGYSMGGGGTTIASTTDSSLKTSIGLAAWGPVGAGITTPTLLLCGESDSTAPCNMSQGSYGQIPDTTPKMLLSIPGATHFSWFGPDDAGMGRSGAYALAFQKVFLDGDERWRDVLITEPSSGSMTTNIH